MATIEEALRTAVDHHHAGRVAEAAVLYERILDAAPESAHAHHLRGVLHAQTGGPSRAIRSIERALALAPATATFHTNLANAIRAAAGTENAGTREVDAMRRAVLSDSSDPARWSDLAVASRRTGERGLAMNAARNAVILDPDDGQRTHILARAMEALGELDGATRTHRRAAILSPTLLSSRLAHADGLAVLGRMTEAEAAYRALIADAPEMTAARYNRAVTRQDRGEGTAAAADFRVALALEPADPMSLLAIARLDREADRLDDACRGFRRASLVEPDNEEALMEERRLSSRAVPAWHFTMLADHARNDAYRRAIEKVVGPGDVVLDIGTGAGLLALFAARAGARHVHTCEMSGALAAVAREVMVDNGYADRVTVHHKRSTALRVGAGRDADLPGHADVLVSEILDAGLLGEGHAPSIRHARAHLLKPGARIIPAAATLWALPMEAPEPASTQPIRNVEGFDLSRLEAYRDRGYVARTLSSIPHRPLSPPIRVARIDLADPPRPGWETRTTFHAAGSGTVHAVALWYDLHLDDAITVSTGPDGECRHWLQAVRFQPRPVTVESGAPLSVRVRHIAGALIADIEIS